MSTSLHRARPFIVVLLAIATALSSLGSAPQGNALVSPKKVTLGIQAAGLLAKLLLPSVQPTVPNNHTNNPVFSHIVSILQANVPVQWSAIRSTINTARQCIQQEWNRSRPSPEKCIEKANADLIKQLQKISAHILKPICTVSFITELMPELCGKPKKITPPLPGKGGVRASHINESAAHNQYIEEQIATGQRCINELIKMAPQALDDATRIVSWLSEKYEQLTKVEQNVQKINRTKEPIQLNKLKKQTARTATLVAALCLLLDDAKLQQLEKTKENARYLKVVKEITDYNREISATIDALLNKIKDMRTDQAKRCQKKARTLKEALRQQHFELTTAQKYWLSIKRNDAINKIVAKLFINLLLLSDQYASAVMDLYKECLGIDVSSSL